MAEICTIVGLKRGSFIPEGQKDPIHYYRAFVLYDEDKEDEGVRGQEVDILKIPADCYPFFEVGLHGEFKYNKRGRVTGFTEC